MYIDYYQVNQQALDRIYSARKHTASIDARLKVLLELRVSQINRCAFCVDRHTGEARQLGEQQQRLDCLPVWKESSLFTDSEMAALAWAEDATNISTSTGAHDDIEQLREFYSESQVVDIALVVSLMNCLNRMAVSFGRKPTSTDH